MRLVDALFRQGHLSEQALVDAVMTGDRPLHLDRCDICAERAVEMNRLLDAVKVAAVEAADQAFPPERLAAQQAQILRRIEQLDEPARVIAFPRQSQPGMREAGRPRVAPAWVGVAAAAGLVIGVIGGQVSARMGGMSPAPAPVVAVAPAAAPQEWEPLPGNATWFDLETDRYTPEPLGAIDDITPRVLNTLASN
jgi:hypothetical protein